MKKLMQIVAFAVVCLRTGGAFAATWTGVASRDIDDLLNWSGDVTASEMQFTGDASLTLGGDYSVFRVFGTSGDNLNVTIDLSGHSLTTTAAANSNRDFWQAGCSTFCITNSSTDVGTLTQTSTLTLNGQYKRDTTLVVSGKKTLMNGSVVNNGGARFGLRVLDGATLAGSTFSWRNGGFSTNLVANGATLMATNVLLGAGAAKPHDSNNGAYHDNLLTVSDAGLSASRLLVGCGQLASSGAPYDNRFKADSGSTVTLSTGAYVGCGAAATNNTAVVTDAGTTFTTPTLRIGTRTSAADGTLYAILAATNNTLLVENGAIVSNKNCYIGAGGNVLKIRSGATFEAVSGGIVQLLSDMAAIKETAGTIGSRIDIEGGTLHYLNRLDIGTKGENDVYGHEVFVGAGGRLSEKPICFRGNGDRLVVSNGTVNVSGLNMRYEGSGTNCIVRIEGADAFVAVSGVTLDGCSPTFEFAIPEDGWELAPFKCADNFTIPKGFALKLDEKALKAYLAAHPTGGTVPLMRAQSSSMQTITISDMDALSANLPSNCKLVNASGVLSCCIKARGLAIFVR